MTLTLTKTEMARLCGVTTETLRTWLNVRYYSDLEKLGYTKNQKVLLPRQVEYLCGKLDIEKEVRP